jgi:hypothetical protein
VPEGFDFLGPRVVMVSSFPPAQCGIGRYADQLVAALRSDREVRTVALAERGSGDVQLDLRGGMRILRLLRVAGREDDVVIQWHPHFFVGGNALSRVVLHLAFAALFRRRRVSVVVHEPYDPPRPRGALGRAGRAVQEWARRICWRSPVRLIFHTHW